MKNLIVLTFILIQFFFLNSSKIFSQTLYWDNLYDGGSIYGPNIYERSIYPLYVDASGNVYICGTNDNYVVRKFDINGNIQWTQTYNGNNNGWDEPQQVVVDGSGNVYVTGLAALSTGDAMTTIKYNSSGTQQWVASYTSEQSWGNSLAVDGDGNVYVAGLVLGDLDLYWEILVVKYNSSGTQQWTNTYNGPGYNDDFANTIKLGSDNSVYVSGITAGGSTFNDVVLIKYNSSGTQQWVATYDTPSLTEDVWNDAAVDMVMDNNDNIYITGSAGTIIQQVAISKYLTLKYNSSGSLQWSAYYYLDNDIVPYGFARSIVVDGSGNVFVTGMSCSGYYENFDYATIKYNSSGTQQWVARYNGPDNGEDQAYSIDHDIEGGVVVTGLSSSEGSGADYATIRYSSNGSELWVDIINGSADQYDIGIAVKKYTDAGAEIENYLFVTGNAVFDNSGIYTVAYYDYTLDNTNAYKRILTKEHRLSSNVFPNPFNPVTVINFTITSNEFVQLIIYDLIGREIQTLVSKDLTAGTYNFSWDASNYPSGIYFYKIEAGSNIETKKMVLVK